MSIPNPTKLSQSPASKAPLNRPASVSRFRPSIADSVIRDQKKSSNIFTSNNPLPSTSSSSDTPPHTPLPSPHPNSPLQLQLPFSSATLAGAALALAASINPMDHSHHHMDHPSIDHGAQAEGAAMRRCSMNMIFNSDPIGTCIVFRQFYVSGTAALVGYLALLFLLAVGYEYLRLATARFDAVTRIKLSLAAPPKRRGARSPSAGGPAEALLDAPAGKAWGRLAVPRHIQLTRSLFYVSNVALSFFLMLVVMTYNAQIILAVLAGAFVGHFLFHRELPVDDQTDKGMACH